ncbi:MAG: glycoside hydrolase family 43 protein [Solobacterium sp.]|nr:glycoside hydrolase family 43 protein [Solobacterium sp.]
MKCIDINIRDPYVLVCNGVYYMYGTRGESTFKGEAFGFDVYKSRNLTDWEGPAEVFHRPENFFSKKNYWAPEVYFHDGKFYMFATFANDKNGLGTAVLVSDSPEGPFVMWSDGYVTPENDRCLDGTLYFSKDRKPYMVYCHEWKQIHDGAVCAAALSDDLKCRISEPRVLFHASGAKPFVKKFLFRNYITDGPFLIRTDDGKLHMLWSTLTKTGYAEAMAHSDNDDVSGIWSVDETPLFDRDGGHGMIFRDLNGDYQLVLHAPNTPQKEHPVFISMRYQDGRWEKNS